jgi:hypothetical protein
MSPHIMGSRGSRRRRRRLLAVCVVSVAALGVFVIPNAFAVHDAGNFELDGNATSATLDDWDRVCHEVTITNDTTNSIPNECASASDTTGTTAVAWTAELDPSATIFTGGGSKDPIDVSSWAWKDAGGLPDKDNLLHAFAARYVKAPSATCPAGTATTCDILYFGSDRFDNSGDAQQGFWFFQNKITLSNVKSGGGFEFNGVHRTGDLLIISDFSNGGTVSTISVYKWNPAVSGNLELLLSSDAANCATASAGDAACGLVNPGPGLTTSPWSFTDKSGNHGFLNGELYEGGINLSTLGLANECFSSVASETRSSTSTTATLKDFVLGQFGNCSATMSTQVSNAGPVVPGTQITDTATIVGSSPTNDPSGDVTFFLCSNVAAGGSCATGGTNLGTGTLVGNFAGTSTATSPAVNTAALPLSPGHYCFRAEWPGDLNYTTALSHTNSTTECFDVKATSAITTAQSWLPQDSATVTVNGATVSGSVEFKLYDSNDCTGTVLGTFTDGSAPFSTNNQTTVSVSTSKSVSWKATFTPSDPNAVVGSTSGCEVSALTITN